MKCTYRPFLRYLDSPPAPGDQPPAPAPAPAPTPTPPSPPKPPSAGVDSSTRLPDDHPLVKAFQAQKDELGKAKQRLNEIDEANKTDAQKQADKIAALEKDNAELKAKDLRNEVAAAKGVPAALISGATKAELEASADALVAFKGGQPAPLPGNPRPAGQVAPVQEQQESREDRRKRLAAEL